MTWIMMTWLFNVTIKWLYFEQHGCWCMIKEWLTCNDMDNIDLTILNDYQMILEYEEPIRNWLQND
jgi:hypothetical protein